MKNAKLKWLIISTIYLASNLLLLFNQGSFWDDWLLLNFEEMSKTFMKTGSWYLIPVYYYFLNITNNPELLLNILTFLLYFMSTIVFYKILKLFKIEQNNIFILTLLFALSPYYQAKETLSVMTYTIGFFMFLFSTLIFLNSIGRKNIYFRIITHLFLFLSFALLNSVLVMWIAFILMYSIYMQKQIKLSFSFFKKIVFQLFLWLDFIMLPFGFWIIRHFFFQPTEQMAIQHYNEVNLNRLILSPINLIISALINSFGFISEIFKPIAESRIYAIGFIILCVGLYICLHKQKLFNSKRPVSNYILWIGIYFFIAGIFPYLAVGKIPSFIGVATRFQIFLPIGASFIILYFLSVLKSIRLQKIAFVVLISAFVIANLNAQIKYTKSWFKQDSLQLHFKTQPFFPENKNYVVIDRTSDYDENERGITHWAFIGMIKKSINQENRLAIESKDRKTYRRNTKFDYYFLIEKGDYILNSRNSIQLLYYYYFDRRKYINNVEKILECKVLPYNLIPD